MRAYVEILFWVSSVTLIGAHISHLRLDVKSQHAFQSPSGAHTKMEKRKCIKGCIDSYRNRWMHAWRVDGWMGGWVVDLTDG